MWHGDLGDGLTAGANDSTSLEIMLDTSNAGVFSGDANVELASRHDELNDVVLNDETVSLFAQINSYADPELVSIDGDGTFAGTDNNFVLDFGTVFLNSDVLSAELGLLNNVVAPADAVRGSFSFGSMSATYTGFDTFSDLAALDLLSGLMVDLDLIAIGSLEDIITVNLFGFNASGFDQALAPIQLTVLANVIAAPVPLPAPLFLLAPATLIALRRRSIAKK